MYLDTVRNELQKLLPTVVAELIDLFALLVVSKGQDTTLEDVHNAWSLWRKTDHEALVPFEDLDGRIQSLDIPYLNAIHAVRVHWILSNQIMESKYRIRMTDAEIENGIKTAIALTDVETVKARVFDNWDDALRMKWQHLFEPVPDV